ncbi:carboxylic ester hydrolase [Procambarus clarkii]|uniref:carboxylic ester hydrolase n=1 Tax=Procambarus clarkii TaxID=6728 RepID=UPI003743525B
MRVSAVMMLLVAAAGVMGQEADVPVVNTEQGRISGQKEHSLKGATFYSYKSIPFAQPPVGALRLKPPVEAPSWDGVRDGSVDPPSCIQVPIFSLFGGKNDLIGSEDCLYLNVFTPSEPGSSRRDLPVMVFIHGGAFYCGSAGEYPPYVFLNHDVVLVVLQYRLGMLGFLSTEDDVIPGNFGLLDQSLALRWVQSNIHHFGGDPQKVTIFGESAGAASVNYHMLSPKSQGLFSQAIMQSGSALSPWSYGWSYRKVAHHAGRALGCADTKHSQDLLTCLQEADAHKLTSILIDHFDYLSGPVILAPRVDGDFLPAQPALLLKEGKQSRVPVITGVTSHEGALYGAQIYGNKSLRSELKDNFATAGLSFLEISPDDETPLDLATRIFHHYLGGVNLEEENADQVVQMLSDRGFVVGHEWVTRLHSKVAATYTYELTYSGQLSLTNLFPGFTLDKKWVSHADDLIYMFHGGPLFTILPISTPEDQRVRNIFTQLWVNFAATGSPTPDASLGFTWSPATCSTPNHLNINLTPSMVENSRKEMMEFWATLPTKENLILDPERVVFTEASENEIKQQEREEL